METSPFRETTPFRETSSTCLWRVLLYTRPNLPQAEWLVMRGLLCWLIDSNDGYVQFSLRHAFWLQVIIDFYVCWTYRLFESQLLHNWPNSSVSCVSASCPEGRGFDPGFSSNIFFREKIPEIILSCMVPIVDSHILSESLWFDINDWFIMYSYILCVCSFISHMGL